MKIILAIIIGTLFGFVLQKVGATNPQKIVSMLRLKDFHLMKVIFLAIGFSSMVLFLLIAVGLINNGHISIKTAYIGVIFGGLIFGLGWTIAGYCPGTALVGAGTGRKDSWFFILGGLVGAFIYTLLFSFIKDSFLFEKLFGGKTTIANTEVEKYISLVDSIPAFVIAGIIGIVFMIIAKKLPN